MNSKNLVQAKTFEKEKWKFHEIHIDYGSDFTDQNLFAKNKQKELKENL